MSIELSIKQVIDEQVQKITHAYIDRLNSDNRAINDKLKWTEDKLNEALSKLSSHNNITKQFIYRDCVPTNIGCVQMSSNVTDVAYINVPLGFAFTYFDIV